MIMAIEARDADEAVAVLESRFLAKQLSLIPSPDALILYEKCGLAITGSRSPAAVSKSSANSLKKPCIRSSGAMWVS
jgi:hypothetical protein